MQMRVDECGEDIIELRGDIPVFFGVTAQFVYLTEKMLLSYGDA